MVQGRTLCLFVLSASRELSRERVGGEYHYSRRNHHSDPCEHNSGSREHHSGRCDHHRDPILDQNVIEAVILHLERKNRRKSFLPLQGTGIPMSWL